MPPNTAHDGRYFEKYMMRHGAVTTAACIYVVLEMLERAGDEAYIADASFRAAALRFLSFLPGFI